MKPIRYSHITHITGTKLCYIRVFAIANPSVVCNVRAPYSGELKLSEIFLRHFVPYHHLTSMQNFTEIIPGQPIRRGR